MSFGPDLLRLLDRYAPAYRPSGRFVPMGNSGGLSGARLWRFPAPLGEFLVRLWPESETREASLRQRMDWVLLLEDLPFLPRPVPALDGQPLQRFLGRLWHVEPWMPGICESDRPPRQARVRAAMQALGLVHLQWERLATSGSSPGLKNRLRIASSLINGGLRTFRDSVSGSPEGPERQTALAWLDEAPRLLATVHRDLIAAIDTPLWVQPTLRDVRSDHLLFLGDDLSGLVDFGALAQDSPACDLARLLADWFEPDDPQRTLALAYYEQNRPLDPRTVSLIDLFERSADLLIGGQWMHWRFVEKRLHEDPQAALRGLETGLVRLRRRIASEARKSGF